MINTVGLLLHQNEGEFSLAFTAGSWQEKQQEIFDEGFTTKQTGSGLGLHICKANLEKQNAKLQLNKSDLESTEFEIILPSA